MIYELRDCRTGNKEVERYTTVELKEENGILTFIFTAKNCKYYCPYKEYNKIHSDGDIVEILIGTDKARKQYYEIEVSPLNGLMLAKMTYNGEDDNGPILDIDFIEEPFVQTEAIVKGDDYVVTVKFDKTKISTGEGEIYFNAYRIDTDGGKCLEENQLLFALNPTMRGKFHTPAKFLWLKEYV